MYEYVVRYQNKLECTPKREPVRSFSETRWTEKQRAHWTETPLYAHPPTPVPAGGWQQEQVEALKSIDAKLWELSGRHPKREPQAFCDGLEAIEEIVETALASLSQPNPEAGAVEAVRALASLDKTFDQWLRAGPNAQPHYADGMRPWGTGDLRWLSQGIKSALAALAQPTGEQPEAGGS